MNKKLYIPLIVFLVLTVAFLVQLQRNSRGDDPKALESALIGKPMPSKKLMIYLIIRNTARNFSVRVNRFY